MIVVEGYGVGKEENLNNGYAFAVDGETTYLAGDNGFIYAID